MRFSLISTVMRGLALLATVLLSMGAAVAADTDKTIRIGAIAVGDGRAVATGIWGLLDNKGWLKEELAKKGYRIKWLYLTGAGPAVNEAFANDTIDVAMYGDLPAIVGKAGGLDTVWVAGNSIGNESALVVPVDSEAKSLADLKGKRIVVHKGRPWELGLALLLDEAGLKQTDFKIYNTPEGSIPNTVASKAVDAAYVNYATALTIEKRQVGRIIWSNLDKPAHWKYTSELFSTRRFRDQHPDAVQVLVDQWVRASAWADQNTDEYQRINGKISGTYDIDVKAQQGKPIAQTTSPTINEFRLEHYRRSAEFARKKGYIRSDIDLAGWLDTSFLDTALKEQQLTGYWPVVDAEGKVKVEVEAKKL